MIPSIVLCKFDAILKLWFSFEDDRNDRELALSPLSILLGLRRKGTVFGVVFRPIYGHCLIETRIDNGCFIPRRWLRRD